MVDNLSVVQDSLKPFLYADEAGRPSRAESAGASEKAEKVKEVEERRDEYIPDDEENEKSAGLYHLEVDEEGKPKIVPDDSVKPAKSGTPAEPEAEKAQKNEGPADAEAEKAQKNEEPEKSEKDEKPEKDAKPEKPEKKKVPVGQAVSDDNAWRAEIAQITKKKAQLAQEMGRVGDDEEKRKALAAQIAQVESELAAKNTDAYRKQRMVTRNMGTTMMEAEDAEKTS